jgi:hypothetical protein
MLNEKGQTHEDNSVCSLTSECKRAELIEAEGREAVSRGWGEREDGIYRHTSLTHTEEVFWVFHSFLFVLLCSVVNMADTEDCLL